MENNHIFTKAGLIAAAFVLGFSTITAAKALPENFWQTMLDAWTNQHLSRAGGSTEQRTFYIATSRPQQVVDSLITDPDIDRVEETVFDQVLIVRTLRNATSVFNRVSRMQGVRTVTSLPFFCH
ncbi:MAG: hypothetical protein AAF402_07300 [Pseudomonadota bacterium]